MSLLSRVAERIYWSARYMERAENTARLVRVYGNLLLDLPRDPDLGWKPLIEISGSDELYETTHPGADERTAEYFLLGDPVNASSILSCLRQTRENIRTTRDIVPSEAWRCTNELVIYAREHLGQDVSVRRRSEVMSGIVEGCQQITGLLEGTMSRGTAYHFLRLGRYLERADMNTRVIDVAAATLLTGRRNLQRFDNRLWMAVLQSLSAYQMYRQNVRRRIIGREVITYLLQDGEFPRALYHCLGELAEALSRLPRNDAPLRAVETLSGRVSQLGFDVVDAGQLHDWIDRVQLDLGSLHERVYRNWLAPSTND